MRALLAVALLTMTVAAVVSGRPAAALSDAEVERLIAKAKTRAEHEAIAAYYDERAAAARASAEVHRQMLESYRKAGGALIEKWHLDHHCRSLIKDYESVAEMNAAMAEAHRKLAAEAH